MPKKRADGRYAKQVKIGMKDGKPIRKTIYGNTIKELDKNYREFMELYEKGVILSEKGTLYRDLHRLWIDNVKKGTVKPQTLGRYYERERFINSYLGDMKPKDIQKSHIEQIRSDLMAENMYIKFNYVLGDIRAVLRYGMDDGILVRDVTANIKRLKYDPKPKRALTIEERQLIEKADLTNKERVFVSLLLYTGTRRNECLALTRDDIDLDKKTICIDKTLVPSNKTADVVQFMTKTEAGNRILPISAPLYPVLEEYCENVTGYLFLTSSGCFYRTHVFQQFWQGILDKMKAANDNRPIADDITPHIFRHTYASDLYKAGYDIKAAQYLLGHTDIATTLDTYTHFGLMDIEISRMENYYETVKKQSNNNIIAFKHA